MPWPMLADYNDALQNPQIVFDDRELKSGKPELDSQQFPGTRTGQFGCVYR